MAILSVIGVLIASYFIGSIPMGLISVKVMTGKDIREIQSGRTGGTNAMRAAGFGVGLFTAIADIAKGAAGVWLARSFSGNIWVEILAPTMVILGHNYSIYLITRDESGRIKWRGGAGGAPSLGGAVGFWWPSFFILVPMGAIILFGVGYASVATMSLPILASIIFAYRAFLGYSPWQYVLYGLFAEVLLIWALRPNLKRLRNGTERLVGWRAKRQNTQASTGSEGETK
jgi:glycerol-3-phosphate acyltransferase PlsY